MRSLTKRGAGYQLRILLVLVLVAGLCPGLALLARAASPQAAHADASTQVMHRLYNPNSGEHFYTASAEERDAVAAAGWDYEGEGWTAPTSSSTPVYRLYSGTDHHYCTGEGERDALVDAGWSYEGVGWYSDDAKGVPLYRQFNPNVDPSAPTNNSGSHNYTTSLDEHNMLVSIGWNDEGIGWYGVDANAPTTPAAPEGVVYQDGVIEVPASSYSGLNDDSVTIASEFASRIVPYETILLLEPSEANPLGSALEVGSVDWQDGSARVSTYEASLSDVVKTIKVSGNTNSVISMTPYVDVEQLSAMSSDTKGSVDIDPLTFTPFEGMSINIKPSIDYSIDFEWGGGAQRM